MISGLDSRTLFGLPPLLHFEPERRDCPRCGAPLKVKYTHERWVETLHIGTFRAHEAVFHCPNCLHGPVYSEELRIS